jgi:FimV-like protein
MFGRVLLLDSECKEAREGLDESRAQLAEERRLMDSRLEQARGAIERGDPERARSLLEDVVREGGDRDRAHALLDRLDWRPGRIEPAPASGADRTVLDRAPAPSNAPSRQAVVAAWTVLLVTLALSLGFSWEDFVARLVRNPAPTSASVPPSTPAPRMAAQALSDARELLDRGQPAAAIAILDGVAPTEPAYPFARELRRQAVAALKDTR